MNRGKFIVLEGLDRSGKSSLAKYLQSQLNKSQETIQIGYPNRTTKTGQMINQHLTSKCDIGNECLHLLFSANRWETQADLKQTLNSGKNIVCDRYWYSGVSYSFAKGLDFEWCIKPDEGLIEPDLIIYLQADPQVLSKRAGYGQQKFERLDFQSKVKQSFEKIWKRVNPQKLKIIDVNSKSLQEVTQQAKGILLNLL